MITGDNHELYNSDCLEVMQDIPDNSINLIATDPPYFRVKGEWWDNQWDTRQGFIEWIGKLCEQWQRILAPNGSLYVFASPQMSAHVEVKIGEYFNVLNCVHWVKEAGYHQKASEEALRGYFPQTEDVIFAEQYNSDNIALGESGYIAKCDELRGFIFEPLRAYFQTEKQRAGIGNREINIGLGLASNGGGMASHYFGVSYQWALPTREHYEAMQRLFNTNGGDYLKREYDYLKREYDDLKREYEALRRPFNASPDTPYTDVWHYPTVTHYAGKHPCEKPLEMMQHIITTSSREGDMVADFFMGSGVTGVAAARLKRSFIGVDLDAKHFTTAAKKVVAAYGGNVWKQPITAHVNGYKKASAQIPLFNGALL